MGLWWGYKHVDNFIIVAEFTDPQSIERAKACVDFVIRVVNEPIECDNFDDACDKILTKLYAIGCKLDYYINKETNYGNTRNYYRFNNTSVGFTKR